jgi:hypothetical protein
VILRLEALDLQKMLEWLKQRVISWFLSRHVGKWIAVDRQNLHGETHSDVWCACVPRVCSCPCARSLLYVIASCLGAAHCCIVYSLHR